MSEPSKGKMWAGRVLSGLVVVGLVMSGAMKLTHSAELLKNLHDKFGYAESIATPLGIIEIGSVVLYAIPQTSVLGAILVTGYLGGAVATHVRIGDAWFAPVILGVLAWAGLFLRDERLSALLPLRKA
ncbi:MAG: DoxX family protein [Byssovorax sp.]